MLALSRKTVRQSWPPYAGAFVALSLGVVLMSIAVTLGAAVGATAHHPGVTADERAQLDDLAALVGVMSGVAVFMALFVVSSTFSLSVASRRRELGLLRLVGATPRQVRRMVLGESTVVALAASLAGCGLGTLGAPLVLGMVRHVGLTDLHLDLPAPWIAWVSAAPAGILVSVLGSWRASKRAARVSPVAALREAVVERRRPSFGQAVVGVLALGGVVTAFAMSGWLTPVLAMTAAVFLPEAVVLAVACFGGVLLPAVAGALARPFTNRTVGARVARDLVRATPRSASAIASPVLAISAIAGSLLLAVSFAADWTTTQDRSHLRAPVVVETHGDATVVRKLAEDPDIRLADVRRTVTVGLGPDGDREPVDVVDLATAVPARGLEVVHGSLGSLGADAVAVTTGYRMDEGTDVGDRVRIRVDGHTLRPRVAAVVEDAPDLYSGVLVSPALVGHAHSEVQQVFVDPGPADLHRLLSGTRAHVSTSSEWLHDVDHQTRSGNALALWVLLGPAGVYAGIAIINAVLIGASQRRQQRRTLALVGATPRQLQSVALWEAGLVGGTGLLLGSVTAVSLGWLVRQSVLRDVGHAPITIPWLPLGAVAALCLGLVLLAGLVGTRTLRR